MKSIRKLIKDKEVKGGSDLPAMPFSEVTQNLLREPCTMKFTGFCSTNQGSFGISGAWLNFCQGNCQVMDLSGNCSACSRSQDNYMEIDDFPVGLFSCWEFMLDAGGRIGLVIFDLDFNNAIIEALKALRFEKSLEGRYPEVNFSLINEWLKMPIEDISISHKGKIQSGKNPVWSEIVEDSGILIIGDAKEGVNSRAPLLTFDHFTTGDVQIYELVGTAREKTGFKFGLLISSNPGLKTLGLIEASIPSRFAYNQVVSAPPMGIPSYDIACSWLNSQVKTCELESMNATNAPEGLQAMIMMEKNSWIIMHKVIETGADFQSTLNEELTNLGANWKTMIGQFRGQS
jgi:hypothetical protein